MKEIIINDMPVQVKEYGGQRVVTLKDIDTVHGRPDGTARKRFNENKKRFIEGEDFFKAKLDEVRPFFGQTLPNGFNPNAYIVLLTESGYLMLVKSFHDDLAWNVQRQLVNSYFRCKVQTAEPDFSGLSPQLQFMIQMEKRQNQLETRQAQLEERFENGERQAYQNGFQKARTLNSLEQNYFKRLVRVKADILYKEQSGIVVNSKRQVQSELYHALYETFGVKAVAEIKYSDLDEAVELIKTYELYELK
jgi:hypothetical protein